MATTLISIVSFFLSLWALRKFRDFTETNRSHFAADHARFIDDQWQKSNHAILRSKDHIEIMTGLLGYENVAETQKAYLIFNFINPLYSAYNSAKQGIMDTAVFERAMSDLARNFSGDPRYLVNLLRTRGYTDEFVDLIEAHLPRPKDPPAEATAVPKPAQASPQKA